MEQYFKKIVNFHFIRLLDFYWLSDAHGPQIGPNLHHTDEKLKDRIRQF
jgi:hypothetical protein